MLTAARSFCLAIFYVYSGFFHTTFLQIPCPSSGTLHAQNSSRVSSHEVRVNSVGRSFSPHFGQHGIACSSCFFFMWPSFSLQNLTENWGDVKTYFYNYLQPITASWIFLFFNIKFFPSDSKIILPLLHVSSASTLILFNVSKVSL